MATKTKDQAGRGTIGSNLPNYYKPIGKDDRGTLSTFDKLIEAYEDYVVTITYYSLSDRCTFIIKGLLLDTNLGNVFSTSSNTVAGSAGAFEEFQRGLLDGLISSMANKVGGKTLGKALEFMNIGKEGKEGEGNKLTAESIKTFREIITNKMSTVASTHKMMTVKDDAPKLNLRLYIDPRSVSAIKTATGNNVLLMGQECARPVGKTTTVGKTTNIYTDTSNRFITTMGALLGMQHSYFIKDDFLAFAPLGSSPIMIPNCLCDPIKPDGIYDRVQKEIEPKQKAAQAKLAEAETKAKQNSQIAGGVAAARASGMSSTEAGKLATKAMRSLQSTSGTQAVLNDHEADSGRILTKYMIAGLIYNYLDDKIIKIKIGNWFDTEGGWWCSGVTPTIPTAVSIDGYPVTVESVELNFEYHRVLSRDEMLCFFPKYKTHATIAYPGDKAHGRVLPNTKFSMADKVIDKFISFLGEMYDMGIVDATLKKI